MRRRGEAERVREGVMWQAGICFALTATLENTLIDWDPVLSPPLLPSLPSALVPACSQRSSRARV
eukprot:3738089-Rhodomonas_salina.1